MAFKCPRWTLANILPVVFVLWIIGTLWFLYSWLHLYPLWKNEATRERGSIQAYISQTLTFLLALCFWRAVATDPGSVPRSPEWRAEQRSNWSFQKPAASAAGSDESEATKSAATHHEVKQTGARRFCKWCDSFKPDRCHHCRVCKSCILRMDHHCPWIANCVGFRNHKFFFLLVLYALLNCSFITVTMSEAMGRALIEEMPASHRFLIVFGMTLSVIMGTLLLMFFILHVWLTLKATTTIEFCEKRTKKMPGKNGSPDYDRGIYQNIKAVLGPMPLLWLLPFCPPSGDGLRFDLKQSSESSDSANDLGTALLKDKTDAEKEPEKVGSEEPLHKEAEEASESPPPEVTGEKAASV